MPYAVLTHRHPTDQLRHSPADGHTSDPLDGFTASLTSGDPPAVNAPNTFPLADAAELTITVDGVDYVYAFDTLDFVDITEATPAEVAAVLDGVGGITATATADNRVRLTTGSIGSSATLSVSGAANAALAFPEDEVAGTDGAAALVLGHAAEGFIERLGDGDEVTVTQSNTLATLDESALRLVGEVRIPTVPAGSSWHLGLYVDGSEAFGWDYADPGTFSLNDIGFSATQQPGAANIGLQLRFDTTDPDTIEAELPAFYIDRVESVTQTAPLLLNRFPYPNQLDVDAPTNLQIQLDIASTSNGVAIDQNTVDVYIDAVLVYDGATNTFQNGWDGGGSSATFGTIYNVGATDARIILQANGLTFTSEQTLQVRVVAQHAGAGTSIDETYSFTTADTEPLTLLSAQAQSSTVVRLTFDDDVDPVLGIVPSNYVFSSATTPSAFLTAVSAVVVSSGVVDVEVDIEMSQGAEYTVTVLNVTDESGNALDVDAADFIGYTCDVPDGRYFQLWDMIGGINRRRDTTGDLQKFILVAQDVVDLLLCMVDKWPTVLDVDIAPEAFVDAILLDLGNPFDFISLSLIDKRRLARILVDIYKTKGTAPGIIDTVRFLTGIEITLDILNDNDFWTLGVSELGYGTILAPGPGDPLWYSFWIDSPVTLTDEQRDQILKIATYMKPAHEHILGIRDPSTTVPALPSFWVLGYDDLGITTLVGD